MGEALSNTGAGSPPDDRAGEDGFPPRRASMRDVAEATGVSVSTVSRALRNAGGISEPVRHRIAEAAAALGYDKPPQLRATPDLSALMAVSLQLFSTDAAGFYREIMEAVEDELDARDIPLETMFLDAAGPGVDPLFARCVDTPGLGIFCVGFDDARMVDRLLPEAAGLILVNGVDPAMRIDGVTPANRRGAEMATRHLLERGHRRIAHISAPIRPTIVDRLDGYRAALAAHDVPFDENLVIKLPALQPEAAAAATADALAKGQLEGVTAVFCGSDMVATGVIKALAEAGRRVPDDMSVVGFDNTRITARTRPGLTTVAVDMREIGRQSVRRLVARLDEPDMTSVEVRVACRLIERESVRAL